MSTNKENSPPMKRTSKDLDENEGSPRKSRRFSSLRNSMNKITTLTSKRSSTDVMSPQKTSVNPRNEDAIERNEKKEESIW
jgi:hypothetical protein